jgi:uncharacterized protein
LEIISLLIVGGFVGVIAGLLGVGGGVIIVPVMVWLYHATFPSDHLMQIALGTSLATIVITSLSSIYAHHCHRAILWTVMLQLTPGIIIGALLGAWLADQLSSNLLHQGFAVFLFIVAAQMGLGKPPAAHRQLPGKLAMNLVGSTIGIISSLVGIGGGSLTVPFLVWCNISIRHAVATSSACAFPVAIAGTIGFIINGFNVPNLPDWSIGYVYLPAFLAIVPTSLLFAPVGARLAHTLPTVTVKRFSAGFLTIVGIKMLYG